MILLHFVGEVLGLLFPLQKKREIIFFYAAAFDLVKLIFNDLWR